MNAPVQPERESPPADAAIPEAGPARPPLVSKNHGRRARFEGLSAAVGRNAPVACGALFLGAGILTTLDPRATRSALAVLNMGRSDAADAVFIVTVIELYLGVLLLLKRDLHWSLLLARGLLFVFSGFLLYLTMLPDPPAFGCLILPSLVTSRRAAVWLGIALNAVVLRGLKLGYGYYCGPGPAARAAPRLSRRPIMTFPR